MTFAGATMTFGEVLAAWYGPRWRRVAPAALGRSRRTLARWCADDAIVPRWAWRRFTSDRVLEKWREIDRRAASERARSHAALGHQKSAVHIAARLVDVRLRRTEFEPPGRRGRSRKTKF